MVKPKFNDLLNKLGIDEIYTKAIKRPKYFSHMKESIPLIEDFNYGADLLFLPTTKEKYKYLLTMVDFANDECDFEPIKTKKSSDVLQAMKKIFLRDYLKKPEASLKTDGGTEFKNEFHNFLIKNKILHKVTYPYRHCQNANIEALNRQIARLLNNYMNLKEVETGETYREWTDILNIIRPDLNKIRKKKLPANWQDVDTPMPDFSKEPKYKLGDIVYHKLEIPYNALGHKQPTKAFRVGDIRWSVKEPREIKEIMIYPAPVNFRYRLDEIPNVAYQECELMLAPKDETHSKFVVKKIIGKLKIKNKINYLIWWQGNYKRNSTYEPRTELLKSGFKNEIKDFELSLKFKAKNKIKNKKIKK